MAHTLFVVHGMGQFTPGWEAGVTTKLDGVAERYPQVTGRFSSRITIKPVTYDNVFSRNVDPAQKDLAALKEFLEVNEVHFGKAIDLDPLFDWLSNTTDSGLIKFFWSHAYDVVLYRFFPLVTQEVRVEVASQLLPPIADKPNGRFSILAHSLGTKVIHDTLSWMGSDPEAGGDANLAINRHLFASIFMLANTSRTLGTILKGDVDAYQSVVHPISTKKSVLDTPGYCEVYRTFKHQLDPVTILRPFSRPTWGRDYVEPADLTHIAPDWNVHALDHFLDHPAVHIPIINDLLSIDDPLIDAHAEAGAIANYSTPSLPPCQAAVKAFTDRLTAVRDRIRTSGDLIEVVKGIAELYDAVEDAKDACK